MVCHALEPGEIFLVKRTVGTLAVDEKEPPGRLIVLIERYRHKRPDAELMLRCTGKTREISDGATVASVPSKAGTRALQGIPANGGVHVVKQKPVRARERQAVWRKPFAFAAFKAPEEDALKIHVTEEEKSLLRVKRLRELFEEEAQGFSEAWFQ